MESQFNKFQSSIEDLNIESYPLEIKEAFYDFLTNVPYIKSLISPNRPYAKDCPRDEEGRIIVDLTNPPIIEDTDYFRPTAIHYQKYGCMTKLRPNPNPNSEYGKWVREETKRCFLGYVRPSDGAWITGEMYFFLNYCPIVKVKRIKGKQGIRVVDFPDFLEGQWLKFMYIHLARENAKHGSELASRGKGKAHPYSEKVFTPEGWKLWKDIKIGDYLYSEFGVPVKVIDIPYDLESDIYQVTLIDGRTVRCTSGHLFKVYNHKAKKVLVKSLIEILEDYISPRKVNAKNTRGREYNYRIPVNRYVLMPISPTPIDPYTLGVLLGDGCFRSNNKNYIGFTSKLDDVIQCYSSNIPYEMHKVSNDAYSYNINIPVSLIGDLWGKKSEDKYIPDEYKFNSAKVRLSILLGLMDTDGTVTFGTPIFTTVSERLKDDVLFIARSLGISCTVSSKIPKYKGKEYKRCYNIRFYTTVPLFKLQRKLNLVYFKNRSKVDNISIVDIKYVGREKAKCVTIDSMSQCYLIDDFIVTHNSYCMASILAKRFILGEYNPIDKKIENKVESFVASYLKNYLNEDGVLNKFESYIDFCSEATEFPKKRLINSINLMHWQMGYKENESVAKKGSLNEVIGVSVKDSPGKLRGKRGAFIGLEEFGSFPNLIELYGTLRPSMEDGDIVFGMIYCQGTAGDKESDFSAALKIMYSPKAFNMQSVPNVYDKVGLGKKDFVYFYPAYVNRNGCYNKDGISDITKAILEVLINRYNVKYNTTDANLITRTIAEHPIVPLEAIMRTRGNMFPVLSINERLNQLDNNPNEYDDVYIGNLLLLKDGTVKFSPDSDDIPIREYPLKDNKNKGAIEIYELPQKDSNGHVFAERYIIGHDPVDDDVSNTSSLTSTFVLDLLTDRIVAEYTGRQEYADSNFEIVRRLCIFYNAKCMYECHPYSLEVIKADGTRTTWQNIHIGDTLNSIGGKTTVVDIPFNLEAKIYKVTLKDGRTIMAGEDHAWDVIKVNCPDKWFTITTKQMLNYGVKDKYNRHIFYIPNAGRVDYPYLEVPIDPYTLGLLLAEGAFTKFRRNKYETFNRKLIQFSSSKEDADFYLTVIPYQMKYIGTKGYSWHLYIDNIDDILKSLGLLFCRSEDKFIPNIYLYNDYNTRLELLKGIMDGDGCASVNGAPVLVTSSKKLKDTVMTLCRSLGLNCSYKKKSTAHLPSYRISVYTDISIFKLPRKVQILHIYRPNMTGSKANSFINKVAIESIEYSHVEMAKCITVDRHDGLYLIGDYVLTHNCNKKGIFSYFSKLNSLQWLAETPTYLKDLQIIKEIGYGNKARGVNATAAINAFADRLTREWLIKPVTVTKSIADSDELEVTLPNLMFVRSRAFLQELAAYNPQGNFDRIRAFGMLMIYRQEKIIMYQGDMTKTVNEDRYKDLAENDEFFRENYDDRFDAFEE